MKKNSYPRKISFLQPTQKKRNFSQKNKFCFLFYTWWINHDIANPLMFQLEEKIWWELLNLSSFLQFKFQELFFISESNEFFRQFFLVMNSTDMLMLICLLENFSIFFSTALHILIICILNYRRWFFFEFFLQCKILMRSFQEIVE